jgi:hypothetical protein
MLISLILGKVKLAYYMPLKELGGRGGLASLLTSALEGGEWLTSCPNCGSSPGKGPRYFLYRRLGGLQSQLDAEGRGKVLCLCQAAWLTLPLNTHSYHLLYLSSL